MLQSFTASSLKVGGSTVVPEIMQAGRRHMTQADKCDVKFIQIQSSISHKAVFTIKLK